MITITLALASSWTDAARQCEQSRCTRREASDAVHGVVLENPDDVGAWVATLQVLDPARVETLPDHLREAQGLPFGWALRVGGPSPGLVRIGDHDVQAVRAPQSVRTSSTPTHRLRRVIAERPPLVDHPALHAVLTLERRGVLDDAERKVRSLFNHEDPNLRAAALVHQARRHVAMQHDDEALWFYDHVAPPFAEVIQAEHTATRWLATVKASDRKKAYNALARMDEPLATTALALMDAIEAAR